MEFEPFWSVYLFSGKKKYRGISGLLLWLYFYYSMESMLHEVFPRLSIPFITLLLMELRLWRLEFSLSHKGRYGKISVSSWHQVLSS